MDIVIPYTKDTHDGLELKYALRSIEKYLTGHNRVIVVGDLPPLMVNMIPMSDTYGRKEYSIKEKILKACSLPDLSEDFIMWHDDHFLLKPLHVKDIKYWFNRSLADERKGQTKGYGVTIDRTISALGGYPLNYDIHTPIIFNKAEFVKLQTWTQEYCVKSMYANRVQVDSVQMDDLKLSAPYTTGQIWDKISGRTFFSTGLLFDETIEVLQACYPHKSRWEK